MKNVTKTELYKTVDDLIVNNGFNFNAINYCVDSIELAKKVCRNVTIEYLDFNSISICGMLYKTKKSTSIALNSRRSSAGRNFDCMHELIHYWLHDAEKYYCDNKDIRGFNDHIEWQANEGAAQFLMPHQIFIPAYLRLQRSNYPLNEIINRLSQKFNVGAQSIKIRISSLKKEIENHQT